MNNTLWLHYSACGALVNVFYEALPCSDILIFFSRYWALAVPTYVMVTIVLAITFYIGMNFMASPPPTSLNIMFGKLTSYYTTISGPESEGIDKHVFSCNFKDNKLLNSALFMQMNLVGNH